MRRRRFVLGVVGSAGVLASASIPAFRYFNRPWKSVKGEPSEYRGPYAELMQIPDGSEFDVCVAGTGPAGTFLAERLASQGVRTLLLEAGHTLSVTNRDPRYARLNGSRNSGSIEYPLSATHLMAPGGTSALWNGRCPRLSDTDFEPNAYTPEGPGWPIRYSDIEPYYGQAEESLDVRGDPAAGTIYPYRSTPLPSTGHLLPDDAPIKKLAQRTGLTDGTLQLAPSSMSPTGEGPMQIGRDKLESIARLPATTLVLGATAYRFNEDASERITSVTVRDIEGNQRTLHAKAYILAGGAVETARRLLLCRSDRWPDGLGNRHGRVGLGFSEHPAMSFAATVELERDERDFIYQHVREFKFYKSLKAEGFGSVMLHMGVKPLRDASSPLAHSMYLAGEIELESSDENRVKLSESAAALDPFGDPYPNLQFGFSARDLATMERTREIVAELGRMANAKDMQEAAGIGWGHHHLGTVRMGADPASSVVDADLKVHGLKNLYLLTSGVFVTGGAVNPTLTIVALGHRLADHLLGRLSQGSFE